MTPTDAATSTDGPGDPGTPRLDADFVARTLGDTLRGRSGPNTEFGRAVVDSRLVHGGDLFVGLQGENHHGAEFAVEAIERGAAGALLPAGEKSGLEGRDVCTLLVDEPLAALQGLGAAWRVALPATEVVGITGSVGKTTTKLMAASVLRRRFRTQATEANYNNEIGVPLCLLELRPQTERGVIEMGMYTMGEISLLCEWARPTIGVVLNIQPVHLSRAGSIETIARAKRELVEALPANGHAILNVDDPTVAAMATHTSARVWTVGAGADAEVRGTDIERMGAVGFAFTLAFDGAERRVRLPAPGAHLLTNALAAAAIGFASGIEIDDVVAALGDLAIPLRLSVRTLPGGITLLDDTYNASPSATVAALDLLAELPGRHVALLGDMLELGEESEPLHAQVGHWAAETTELLITVGELAAGISAAATSAGHPDAHHARDKGEALELLRSRIAEGDAVLIKGSRALALETVVRALKAGTSSPPSNEDVANS